MTNIEENNTTPRPHVYCARVAGDITLKTPLLSQTEKQAAGKGVDEESQITSTNNDKDSSIYCRLNANRSTSTRLRIAFASAQVGTPFTAL